MKQLARQISAFKKIYIVGTSTDVGKSYVGSRLLSELISINSAFRPLKPIETGLEKNLVGPDTALYKAVLDTHGVDFSVDEINPFNMNYPCSPHLSKELENKDFSVDELITHMDKYDFAQIELAGGIYVPINETETQLDLLKLRPYPCVLVADAALGVLNHSMLSIEALKSVGIENVFIILNKYDKNDFIHRKNFEYLSERYPVSTLELAI